MSNGKSEVEERQSHYLANRVKLYLEAGKHHQPAPRQSITQGRHHRVQKDLDWLSRHRFCGNEAKGMR